MSQTAKELECLNQEYESILSRKEQVSKKKEDILLELKNTNSSVCEQEDALELACAKLSQVIKAANEQKKNTENNNTEQDFASLRASAEENIEELKAKLEESQCLCMRHEAMAARLAAQEAELEMMCEELAACLKEVASKS